MRTIRRERMERRRKKALPGVGEENDDGDAHFKKFLSSAKTSAAENGPDLDIFGPAPKRYLLAGEGKGETRQLNANLKNVDHDA
jgi:hypothetical protein